MKAALLFLLGAACGAVAMVIPEVATHLHAALRGSGKAAQGAQRVHTEEAFAFTARASMSEVAPLFGADKERVWAAGWNPQFIHPLPPGDEQGMVFKVAHNHLKATWVNTQFDTKNGRVQYVYVIPDALVTVITIQLTPQGSQTQVNVQYDRTALSMEADDHVRHMAEGDRNSGPDWEKQINGYLEKTRKR